MGDKEKEKKRPHKQQEQNCNDDLQDCEGNDVAVARIHSSISEMSKLNVEKFI